MRDYEIYLNTCIEVFKDLPGKHAATYCEAMQDALRVFEMFKATEALTKTMEEICTKTE